MTYFCIVICFSNRSVIWYKRCPVSFTFVTAIFVDRLFVTVDRLFGIATRPSCQGGFLFEDKVHDFGFFKYHLAFENLFGFLAFLAFLTTEELNVRAKL